MYKATTLFLFLAIHYSFTATAQEHNDAYKNSYLGWTKIYRFKGFSKSAQVDEKKYSIAQLSNIDSFANWMQASYTPKGCLGEIKKYVTPKKNVYHERYNEAVPQSYGANAACYTFLKQTNGKWQPYLNFSINWTIAANEIPLDSREIDFNTKQTCLFTLPQYDEWFLKENPNSDEAAYKKLYSIEQHPVTKKYLYYQLKPSKTAGVHHLIILSKNNRPPFLHVTIGEALQFAEAALPVKYAEEKQTITEQNAYNAPHLQLATENLNKKFTTARETINKLRVKYKTKLDEKAYLKNSYSIQDLANGADIFSNGEIKANGHFNKELPLYKTDAEMQEKCSTDKPQWIAIKWFGGRMDETHYKHMQESILNNFDFDYAYNFFFDPEKIKGKQYKQTGMLVREEKVVLQEQSSAFKKAATDASVFFFDDFSENAAGQKPIGWKTGMNSNAQYPLVTSTKNLEGKWLEIIGHTPITPQKITYPLPQNFELSFDLAVPKDIPWGAKAFTIYLGTAKQYVENGPCVNIRIRAGFSGRPGETSIECKFGSGYPVNAKPYYDATGFSNDLDINKVTVRLRKKGETLEYYLNHIKIAEVAKAIPAGTVFNWLQLGHLRSDGENQKYYLTNFKIINL